MPLLDKCPARSFRDRTPRLLKSIRRGADPALPFTPMMQQQQQQQQQQERQRSVLSAVGTLRRGRFAQRRKTLTSTTRARRSSIFSPLWTPQRQGGRYNPRLSVLPNSRRRFAGEIKERRTPSRLRLCDSRFPPPAQRGWLGSEIEISPIYSSPCCRRRAFS